MKILLFLLLALPAMAGREFVNASGQFGVCTIASQTPPITIAAWAWPKQDSASLAIFGLNASDNASERLQVFMNGTLAGDPFGVAVVDSTGTSTVLTGGSANTNAYQHVVGVFTSATSRTLYVGGAPVGTNTTSRTANGLTIASVGAVKSSSVYTSPWTGEIAEVAVWSVALTDAEILSLSVGSSPLLIRPANLVFYSPLTGRETSSEWNLVGSAVSLTNSPAASANHPRIYNP